jgi:hypothetical protein
VGFQGDQDLLQHFPTPHTISLSPTVRAEDEGRVGPAGAGPAELWCLVIGILIKSLLIIFDEGRKREQIRSPI